MPRDANGNYTLPTGNPVVTGTVISADGWANPTLTDLATEMQDSVSRSGKGALTAPLGVVDFAGSVPGLNFAAEPTSGLKREASNDVRIQVTATDVLQCIKTGTKVLTPETGGTLQFPVVELTGRTIMRGVSGATVVYFYNNTAPPGWTIEAPDANLRELVVGPSAGGGTIGGSADPTSLFGPVNTTVSVTTTSTGVSQGHILTVAEMPSHRHEVIPETVGITAPTGLRGAGSTSSTINGYTRYTGGDGAHSHAINSLVGTGTGTGTGNVTITPRYARGILAKLD